MTWITAALLGTASFSMVNIIDSHLLAKRLPGVRTLLLPAGIIHLIYGSISFYIFPLPEGIQLWPIVTMVASSMFRSAAVFIILYNLKREEVSRVIPIVYTYPVFVAIMAMPLLGEILTYLHWLAIIIVVAGAVVISLERSPYSFSLRAGKPFLLLFVASLLLAVADITGKYALGYISSWNGFSISIICIAGMSLLFSLRPHVIKELRDMKQRNTALVLVTINETIAPVAMAFTIWATKHGP
ncbi:EamA family transporter, partial [Chloroflexota bacterium]